MAGVLAVVVAVLLGVAQAGSATNPPGFTCQGNPHEVTTLGNWNTGGVSGGGTPPTFDTGSAYYCLDEIDTYHTPAGSAGGSVSLSGAGSLGPFTATAQANGDGLYNWIAPVPAGTVIHGAYTCHDSDPSTWAQDSASSGQGFCKFQVEDAVDSAGPTVQITSPGPSSDLSGTVTVTANASDNVGVDHVTFQIRDISTETTTQLGTVSSAPYSVSFDSTTLPNCEHDGCTIEATAYDAAGNSSSDSVDVGIANPIVVDDLNDDTSGSNCSLRQAIASANDNTAYGDCKNGLSSLTDTIDIPAGTYDLSVGQLLISSNMNLVGAGARSTILNGGNGQRVFEITGASEVEIGGVTIQGGTETESSGTDNAGVGGGIWLDSNSSLILRDSTITGNEADISGGGIASDGSLEIIRSTIENNNTPGYGGGIDDHGGQSLSIYTSTIMGNTAQGDGGGLDIGGPATLTNATVANNEAAYFTATGSGGGIALFGALPGTAVSLTNTLLAGNTELRNPGTLVPDNCSVGVSSNGYNLADDSSCDLTATGDMQNTDPQLGPVDTSGPEDVLPLLAGSPAIDAADDMLCPDRDEILTHRPQGAHCDIGAYEYVPPPTDYNVSTPQELASAITSAESYGVPATIHLAAGQYDIGNAIGSVDVSPASGAPITLAGAGAGSTILDGDGSGNDVVDLGGSEKTTIEDVTIENGRDGIYDNGALDLSDSVVQNNTANGVESTNHGLTVSGSTISGNGDGVYVESSFSAVNTTIAGNGGFGLDVDYSDSGAGLENVTIAGNTGAGLETSDATTAVNTIVANNAGGDCSGAQSYLTSNGHNLDSDGSCFSFDAAAGDLPNTDPQLGALQDNGGPTPTMALAPGSPAVDAGDDASCPSTDQRGIVRAQGAHCDIGAFELESSGPPPPSDLYVDASWVDLPGGTTVVGPSSQELTIGTDAFADPADALNAVTTPGVTVHVAAGTYNDSAGTLYLDKDGEKLVGAGPDSTHLTIQEMELDGHSQTVQGLDLTATVSNYDGIYVRGSVNSDSFLTGDTITGNRISGGYGGIDLGYDTGANLITDNEISGAQTGILVDGSGNNTIDGNDLHDNGASSGSGPNASILVEDTNDYLPPGNAVTNNTIQRSTNHGISVRTSGNTIEGNTIADSGTLYPGFKESSGIEVVGYNENADHNHVEGNTITGSAFAGIKIGFDTDSNVVSGNTITGTLHAGANGSSVDPAGGGSGILLTGYAATNTSITGNTLTGNSGYGLLQEPSTYGNSICVGSCNTAAHQNTISGNGLGGVDNGDAANQLDATSNWWGDPSGPSGVGPGSGDSVSANVLYAPWLTAPPSSGSVSPTIEASVDQDNVSLSGWPSYDVVTVTVAGMPFVVTTDANGSAFLSVQQTRHDIVPGEAIAASDTTGNSQSMTVAAVEIDTVDPSTGLVTGLAPPGASVQVNENRDWTFLGAGSATASGDGVWSATVPVAPLTGAWDVSAVVTDGQGNHTSYDVNEPVVRAGINLDYLNTWGWPANENLTITVNGNTFDAATGGGGLPNVGAVNVNRDQVGDIQPGSTVDVTGQFYGQTVTKHLQVVGIQIDNVDTATNTVSGTAPANAVVQLDGTPVPPGSPPLQTTADGNGNWSVSLPNALTGQWQVTAQTPDADGDLSAWQAQLPWIEASLSANTIQGHAWPANDSITLTIGSTTETTTTNGNGDFLVSPPQQTATLSPGTTVEASDGTYDKQLTLVPMTFDTLDPTTQVAAGTAPAGASVQVCLNDGGTFLGCQNATADSGGAWSTTFPGGTIAMGVHGVASTGAGDEDGDQTSVETTVAPTVSLDAAPPAQDTTDGSTFAFSSPTSGAQFQCQVDGGGFQPCSSPDTLYLANGSHTFQVEAGANGNFGAPASFTWTTNVAAPPADTLVVDAPPYAIDSLDTGIAFTTSSWQVLQATCDTLYTVSNGSPSDIVPLSATGDPVVSSDGLTATITVRSGLKFASGEDITAQSFADAVNRLQNPALGSGASYLADGITSATADGQTLVITMSKPLGDLASRLTVPDFCPVPSGTSAGPVTSEVGSGPYTIVSSGPSEIDLDRNAYYGGPRNASFAHIRFDLGVDPATAEARVLAGTSDYIIGGPPSQDASALQSAHPSQLFENPALTFWYVGMNTTRAPFNNPVLRRAISYALNRNAIAAALSGTRTVTPTDTYVPTGTPGSSPPGSFYPLGGNLAAALNLAAQAGVSPANPITATYYAGSGQFARQVEPLIAADLAQIGIILQPVFAPNLYSLLGDPSTPDDLFFSGWAMDYPDPSDIFDNIFASSGNTNYEHYSGDDAAIAAADAAPLATRFGQWATVEQNLATGDAPVASVLNATNVDLFSSRLHCQQYNPISGMDIASLCLTPAAGSLSGSVAQNIVQPADLTSTGSEDWAVWGRGMGGDQPNALPPTDYKANGGREISDLTVVNGGTPRGFGTNSDVPFNFSWSDGTPLSTGSNELAGLTAPAVGTGLSFTVPADTTKRTLTIWASAHYAGGTLSASLSDQSAPVFTQTVEAYGGQFTNTGENVPEVFTISYRAAHPGQTLTVTWSEASNNGCPGCDDVVLYAAALSGGSHVSSASASFGADQTVGMSGSNDSIDDIPLSAFEVTPQGITPAPINGLPINGLPINGLPINGLPINGLPINGLPINGLPINGLPINGLPINGLPINGLPINGLPINGLPINGLELPGTSWQQILAGTPLANQPLQDVTLQQVLALDPKPAAIQNLTLGELEVADSNLGKLTIGALVLGSTPINGLGTEAATIEQQLQAWCERVVTSGDPATDCSLSDIGRQSLFGLGLAGAPINGLPINGLPINGLPINGLPINGLPINGLDLSASPINGLPINGLPINGLPINGLPVALSAVIDCTKVDCATATLGEAAAAGAIPAGTTYGQLLALLLAPGSAYADTITLGDVIGLLIQRADVPWEDLSPRLLSFFDPNRPTMSMTAGFTVQGSGLPGADVKLDLPAGFDYVPGSAGLTENSLPAAAPGDPAITHGSSGEELDWQFDAVDPGASYQLTLRVYSGSTVGSTQATETVTAGSFSDSSIASFSVVDSFGSSSDPIKAPTITPNEGVQMSALASPGAVEYFKIPMPAAGSRIQVHLTNLAADYDLALYSNQTTSVRTGATSAPPLQDGIVPDQSINVGGANGQLTPTALQDVPDPGIPVVQVSANRGTDDEDVGMVSPGGSGFVTIAVFGYNGAFSPQPFTLRVTSTPPPATESCPKRVLPDAGQGTTLDTTLPDPSSLPANLNTIILVDEQRLGDTYGSTDETNAVAKLHDLAGDSSLGVSGVVIPVETIPGVQGLYDQWDSNPCNPDAANAVANAIANEVDAIVAARPSVKYVVFGGGDDQIPFFRLPDLSLIANESGFAGQFGPNEYQGSLAAGDLLSDDPYLDTNPVPASGQQLFPPNLAGGRLVETAQDIANAVTNFENAPTPGELKSSTAFVSGYDFVADSAKQIASNLIQRGISTKTLIDDPANPPVTPWSGSDLLAGAFPTGGPADINSWDGHYDNYRLEAANGDILTTSDLPSGLNGGVFFTMGCHAGFQTTDAVVGSSVLDWPQYFAEHDTGFVGNTGFGLGDTDSIAFSEQLMTDFSQNLGGSMTLGQALLKAKQSYYLSRVAFSNYDEKTLSEAELYGLPMYGVGSAPVGLAHPLSDPSPDPVNGSTQSTSPSQGSLSAFPGTGVQSASFSSTPDFGTAVTGQNGDYYTNDGQVQAPNYRPLQPFVSLPAARSGLVAHGVVVDGLTSEDHTTDANGNPWQPDNVRPILNASGDEPPPSFTDEAWPEKIPTLVSLGANQSLNLATGQFFTDTSGGTTTPVERLWTQIDGRVTYSSSQDFTPPTIDSIDAFQSNGVVTFTGRFSDRDQNGDPGTVVFAQVVYDDDTGHWHALPLTQDSSSGAWLGGATFGGDHIQYFVEACDAAGNCGYSSNKGDYFDAQPLPSGNGGGGTLSLNPGGTANANGWYQGSLPVTVSAPTGTSVSVTVDGKSVTPDADGQITISGDGAHTVSATDSDGHVATAVYLLDSTAPTDATTFASDGSTYSAAQWNAGCSTPGLCGTAADTGGSGVASVQLSVERNSDGDYWNGTSFVSGPETYLGATGTTTWSYPLSSAALDDHGSYTVHVRATDNAGNTSSVRSLTFSFLKTYNITFGASGIPTGGSSDSGTSQVLSVSVAGGTPTTYTAAQLPATLPVLSGSSVSYSYGSIEPSSASGKRYRLTGHTGPDSGFSVGSPTTVTGNYATQWQVTFAQSGIGSDTGVSTIATVGGTSLAASDLGGSGYGVWADDHSSLAFTYASSVASNSSSGGVYILQNGASLGSPLTVTAPQTVTGTYALLQAKAQTVTVYANSTANPIDVLAGDSLAGGKLASVQSPTAYNGTAALCASCVSGGAGVSYAPYANFLGTDTFTYTIADATGAYQQTATVTVNVIASGSLDDSNFLEDAGFNNLGGDFNVLFANIPHDSAHVVLRNTDPPELHLVATVTNDTGVDIGPPGSAGTMGAPNAQLAAIFTIPGMPKSCNLSSVPDCSNPGGLGQPAFVVKGGPGGADAVHVHPDGKPSDMSVTVLYKDPSAASPCSDTSHDYVPYGSLVTPGVAKCVLVTGISIPSGPHRPGPGPAWAPGHSAQIDLRLTFRPLNTIWPASPDPQVYFAAGMNFQLSKIVTVSSPSGGNPQVLSGKDDIPIVANGKHVTAIGGFAGLNIPASQVFGGSPGDPMSNGSVYLYNVPSDAGVSGTNPFGMCPATPSQAGIVGSDTLTPDAGGFYYIWETGTQAPGHPPLPWGVRYFVQVCGSDGHAYAGTLVDHSVGNKEFEEQDFVDFSSPRPTSLTIPHHDGKPSSGDTLQIAFSQPLDEASMCGVWGADNTVDRSLSGVTVQLNDGGSANDVLSLDTPSVAAACGVGGSHFGSIDLGSTGYNTTGAAITFTNSKIQWNHNGTLTVTLGAPSAAVNAVTTALTATYTPDPSMLDPGGNPIHGTTSDSQTGALNSNF